MSVRAYIVREERIWVDEKNMRCYWNNDNDEFDELKEYVHKSEEECIDVWGQADLINEMFKFGANDYTNNETVGLIEMSYDDFMNMEENSKLEFTDFDRDSLMLMMEYFNEKIFVESELKEIRKHDIITLNCY